MGGGGHGGAASGGRAQGGSSESMGGSNSMGGSTSDGGSTTALGGEAGMDAGMGGAEGGAEPNGGTAGMPEPTAGTGPVVGMGGANVVGEGGVGGAEAGAGGDAGAGGAPVEACLLTMCGDTCVDTDTSPVHCGSCDNSCVTDGHTTPACVEGACAPTCATGFADCSHPAVDDGCETNLNANATCGTSCGTLVVCDAGQICMDGACVGQELCDKTLCGDTCVDPQVGEAQSPTTDHCGACDHLCSTDNASNAACTDGTCAPTCNDGYADCSTPAADQADDGCETNIATGSTSDTTVTNCGGCDRACSSTNVYAASCAAGKCAPTCSAGFADCNIDTGSGDDDGCETNLNAAETCGTTCGNVQACTSGKVCEAGACVKPNLLTNGAKGTFEGADGATNWYSWAGSVATSTKYAHSGTQSLLTTARTGTNSPSATDITAILSAGNSYKLSMWVTIGGAASDTARMVLHTNCGGTNSYDWVKGNTTVTEGTWVLLEGTWTIAASCVLQKAELYIEGPAAAVDVYIDDASVR